ncbi:hypothetical protein STRTUCAR8_03278, partial [Streptomyces turgidiscabies Car8]
MSGLGFLQPDDGDVHVVLSGAGSGSGR